MLILVAVAFSYTAEAQGIITITLNIFVNLITSIIP